ncbi:activator of prop osmoprotectant transporter [Legionella qingyii]|uniref:Activator of prop osmoprotectant transporter n=1 Tax=Legionella qingyii TaxID=2184757 RepID=A0A317U0Y5_9GAMM|nr:ProQ/FinO family protein [Legionella qingyii]PWY55674.1 activator of prop osmoprotectant transporter [Legionella qingyii]RUR21658.1 activator of prop osmoprotectant transporter [Legionella qingyii]RUR25074.1 activator of prop osmoprotectant transporter [Legionella qingyii]
MRKQELHPRTAVINKAQKIRSKKARTDALLWLAAHFPAAFDNSLRIRPLKVGIMDDILLHADKAEEAGISKSKLREAVVLFTRRLDYLACLKLREMRVDLQGNEVAAVTEEEAEHAATKIRKRVEKSVRNARKTQVEKTISQTSSAQQSTAFQSQITGQSSTSTETHFPTYPVRSSTYNTLNTPAQPARTTAVVVKNKTARQYDPDAVARLKEKLGLSRSEKKEIVE